MLELSPKTVLIFLYVEPNTWRATAVSDFCRGCVQVRGKAEEKQHPAASSSRNHLHQEQVGAERPAPNAREYLGLPVQKHFPKIILIRLLLVTAKEDAGGVDYLPKQCMINQCVLLIGLTNLPIRI